jgi:hypothetical protein
MLTITVGAADVFDEGTQQFTTHGGTQLQLEHSLVSLSKWESIHEKPFLGEVEKSSDEVLSYIECMLLGEIPRGDFLTQLSEENFQQINAYIDAKMTATWFSEQPGAPKASREVITSELIYYWMTVFHIPFECETWHLNRLFTLIRICNVKQSKPKKMSRGEIARRNRELNAQRKAQLGTKG